MTLAEIHAAIPHREPFLLIDEIVERAERGSCAASGLRATNIFTPATIPIFR